MDFTPAQKNMMIAMAILSAMTIIVMAFLTNYWYQQALPPIPCLEPGIGRTRDSIQMEVANYKNLVTAIRENQSFLNDLLVAKFLKGLFDSIIVAIITFVFARPVVQAVVARINGNRPG